MFEACNDRTNRGRHDPLPAEPLALRIAQLEELPVEVDAIPGPVVGPGHQPLAFARREAPDARTTYEREVPVASTARHGRCDAQRTAAVVAARSLQEERRAGT